MKKLLAKRLEDSHKASYGRIAIIAGSRGMAGAAYLACESALRTGSGLVYSIVPESLGAIMSIKLIEAIIEPIADNGKGYFISKSIDRVLKAMENMDAIGLGPGIGVDKGRVNLVREIIRNTWSKMIIDADGINCIAKDINILKEKKGEIIITPHPGEMARLLNLDIKEVQNNRKYYAQYISEKYNITTVLKGHKTIVASPDGETYINTTGNPGMATAGSGDVLTGIITSLLGQGLNIFDAGKLGVYLHGLVGDMVKEEKGEYGLLARDLVEFIPYGIMKIENSLKK